MQIGKFQLDHLVEKKMNLYLIEAADNKFFIILLNRKANTNTQRFPFKIPESEGFDSELIEFHKQLKQIRHRLIIIQFQLIAYRVNYSHSKTYLQIYILYNYYYQEYQERRIKERFRINENFQKRTQIDIDRL
ncbi:unnamed protein product [Paramecium sonneborni]|uniref:Uncharacterized protein n=1 Tax=Paramecium sonneborni TaxID=65129 RepID=A0A8S1QGU0_9CILI|nr:unnamed protein product [Paramecium sonneborni]